MLGHPNPEGSFEKLSPFPQHAQAEEGLVVPECSEILLSLL